MGNRNSTYITELSDDDGSDSNFDYSLEPRVEHKLHCNLNCMVNSTQNLVADTSNNLETDYTNKEINLTTDAAMKTFPKPELAICLDEILEIEKSLDQYEMVSLVYLLYENPNYALQELTLFLKGAQKNLLYSWAILEEQHSHSWQNKLIEALCIIKNYQVLRSLGYQKQDLISHYLPHLSSAITKLNKVKKAIYLICEKLNCEKTHKFLKSVKLQFQEKGMNFVEDYDPQYLELYFLQWETVDYISMTDMSNVKSVLKVMEEEVLYDILESAFRIPQQGVELEKVLNIHIDEMNKTSRPKIHSTSTDTHQLASTSKDDSGDFQSSSPSIGQDNGLKGDADNHSYYIDPQSPGVLLIINQENFCTEIDEKFIHLLPEDIERNKLEDRDGTEKDKENLVTTFKKFGFTVIIEDNLYHEELISKVRETLKNIRNESSLFVCIMSHGDKGVVYGVNSCKVKVSKIQDVMCRTNKENLSGKPKILILQSCQGKQCQRLNDWSEDEEEYKIDSITTDGPNVSKSTPRTVDMLTFWATVPGYAAIRHRKTGSWFIQALCNKMTELGNKHHFEDICTRIISDVSNETWIVQNEKNVMTPMKVSTLRKYFYLPPMRNK